MEEVSEKNRLIKMDKKAVYLREMHATKEYKHRKLAARRKSRGTRHREEEKNGAHKAGPAVHDWGGGSDGGDGGCDDADWGGGDVDEFDEGDDWNIAAALQFEKEEKEKRLAVPLPKKLPEDLLSAAKAEYEGKTAKKKGSLSHCSACPHTPASRGHTAWCCPVAPDRAIMGSTLDPNKRTGILIVDTEAHSDRGGEFNVGMIQLGAVFCELANNKLQLLPRESSSSDGSGDGRSSGSGSSSSSSSSNR